MRIKHVAAWLAASGGWLMWSAAATAQHPSPNTGHALDANNQVGSGGINQQPQNNNQVTGNQIITGNVTGGRAFRGFVPYTDPHYFRARLGSQGIDEFVKNSTGVPAPYQAPPRPNEPQPFYSASRLATPPPPGFQTQVGAGAYLPAPRTDEGNDPRIGRPIEPLRVEVVRPGDLLLMPPTGDVRSRDMTVFSASPLSGVQQWRPEDLTDPSFLNNYTGLGQQNSPMRLNLDPAALQRMREEINKTDEGTTPAPNGPLQSRLSQPLETPADPRLGEQPMPDTIENNPLAGNVRPEQSMQSRLLAAPTAQSTQYAELRNRLDTYYIERLKTDEQANRDLLAQLRARQAAEQARNAANPPQATTPPTSRPAGMAAYGLPDYARISREIVKAAPPSAGAATAAAPPPRPLPIASLADGVKAPGLAGLLKQAEILMRQGKFASALDQYEAAGRVAPNNSLVWLGGAHAELGAMFYGRAEGHLRQALTADPTLLMGQYDLRQMMGQQRLGEVVKDLKTLAETDPASPRPVFLLAYIAYNTGSERQAGMYLELAQKRAGGHDTFYQLLRQHWALGGASTSAPTR